MISRRKILSISLATIASGGAFSYLYPFEEQESLLQKILDSGDNLNLAINRLLLPSLPQAKEYDFSRVTPNFPSLGGFGAYYVAPDRHYDELVHNGFRGWNLEVTGMVRNPLAFSLDDIRKMPYTSSTVMHVCQEGWDAIAQWGGVRLSYIMQKAGVMPQAKYAVFHAMDTIAGQKMFGSLPINKCLHPQTILAYEINKQPLPVAHGAPLRLRSALDVGYKQVKHLRRIEFVSSLAETKGGKGGLFEIYGYQKFGGI